MRNGGPIPAVLLALTLLSCGADKGKAQDLTVDSKESSRDCGQPPLPEKDCSKVTEFTAGIDTVKCSGKTMIATWHHAGACSQKTESGASRTYTCSYTCNNTCKIPFIGCVDPLHGKALIADICK